MRSPVLRIGLPRGAPCGHPGSHDPLLAQVRAGGVVQKGTARAFESGMLVLRVTSLRPLQVIRPDRGSECIKIAPRHGKMKMKGKVVSLGAYLTSS